jgi:dihydrofolate reductase
MRGSFRIEGYAIVSADGMIADAGGLMPDSLKIEADQRFYAKALERAAVVAHGRLSHEGQPNSASRRRLILTRRVRALAADPHNPNAKLWNPAGATFEEACAAVGCRAGTVAIVGGTDVYSLFLKFGYDDFYLSRTEKVRLPGGVPCFAQGRFGSAPEQVLNESGLNPRKLQRLDDGVTLVEWTSSVRSDASLRSKTGRPRRASPAQTQNIGDQVV